MNVLLVGSWDNLGGVCSVVNQLAKHLRAQGHQVFMLHPGDSLRPVPGLSRLGFRSFRMNLRPTSRDKASLRSRMVFLATLPFTLLALVRLLRKLKIDVVNVHYPVSPFIYFGILRKLGMTRLLTSIHGADLLPNGVRLPSRQLGIRAVLRASDLIVTPSNSYRKVVTDSWPELRKKWIETIPNGVDHAELGYDPKLSDAVEDPPYILSILHLVLYKGVDILIKAFAEIADEMPSLRLKLISGGPNQKEFAELAKSLGVGDRVDFLGFVEKPLVAQHLRGCLFFVLPSRSNSESFGIAAVEAMAVDRAVIGSRIGGLPEIITDEMTGLLVPPGDISALATAMRRLVRDPDLRRRLGKTAGDRVREEFPWARTSAYYEAMFLRLAGQPIPASRKSDPHIMRISGSFPTTSPDASAQPSIRP